MSPFNTKLEVAGINRLQVSALPILTPETYIFLKPDT
jgi:hypothetical protein